MELELPAIELPDDRAPPIQAGRASSDQPTKAASGSTKAKRNLKLPRMLKRLSKYDVLITSNLPFSKWEAIFKDPMVTAAAIDQLVHHCVILELNIGSYRMSAVKKKVAEAVV